MTQERRKDDHHPDRPLDWSDTENLAGQEWKAPAAPQAVAGKGEVPALIAALRALPIETPADLKEGLEATIYEHGHRDAISAAVAVLSASAFASPAAPAMPQPRPTDDHLWDETIRDRDTYHEWADKLAEAISKHFGAYIGEHSNTNCPWAEALEAIEAASPASAEHVQVRKATTELSLPELAREFAAAEEMGFDFTLSPGVCGMLFRAMTTPPVAAPSSPSVSGTVDTAEAVRNAVHAIIGPGFHLRLAKLDIASIIDQHTAQAVRAAREEALEEAAKACENEVPCSCCFSEDEIVLAANLAASIRALATPQAAGTEQEKKQ